VSRSVDLEIADSLHVMDDPHDRRLMFDTIDDVLDARDDLTRTERLGNIVVGSEFKTHDAIDRLVT